MKSYVKNGDTIAYDETMIAYQLMPQDFSRFVGQLVLMDDDAVGAEEPSWLEAVELERINSNGDITIHTVEGCHETISKRKLVKHSGCYVAFYAIKPEILNPPEPAPETAVVVSAEYTKAVTLTRHIIAEAQAMQASLYEVCKGLKEMRDGKLYKELGYQNFEDYCVNEIKITYRQAKKYVAIATGFSELEGSRLPSVGTEKLYLLSMLEEVDRQALTERIDPNETTVKELKTEIQKLKSEKEQLEDARRSKHQEWLNAMDEITTLTVQKSKLEEQVQELENQEPEPVYIDNPQAEQKFAERLEEVGYEWEQKYDEMEQEKDRQIIALKREQHQKEQEFQQKLKEAKNAGGKKGSELDAYLKMFRDTLSHITALLGNPSMMDFERKQVLSRLQTIYEEYTGAVKDD
jgi:hypothetical protein